MRIFTGNANPELAGRICQELDCELGALEIGRFADGEVRLQIHESIRGQDCFLIQPTCRPTNDNLMELLVMIDAFRRGSAERIVAVIPYFGYGRQDRKARGREPITAKLIANLITHAGAHRVLTVDLHAAQVQGFFDIPVDHLTARTLLAEYFRQQGLAGPETVVVAPDEGGADAARRMADEIDASLAIIAKRRPAPNQVSIMNVIGELDGRRAIMLDDMVDTGGTMVEGAKALLARGAAEVHCAATHAVLSEPAVERFRESPFKSFVFTDTVPVPPEKRLDNMTILSVGPLLAEAMKAIHCNASISTLLAHGRRQTVRIY
jgi:ribose-phosphate pyrophosphokinase